MGTELIDHDYGPAMKALQPKQKDFVESILMTGRQDATEAYLMAYPGASPVTARTNGSRLLRDNRILAAMHEEGIKRVHSGIVVATSALLEIADGGGGAKASDRLKAAGMILNRVGIHEMSEHHLIVEHTGDDRATVDRIISLAAKLGIDPKKLLGDNTMVDVEFTDITPSSEGLEDIL